MNIKFLILFFLIIVSCSTNRKLYRDSEINKSLVAGKVISEEGLPLEGVNVKLDSFSCMTDINGRFFFNNLFFGKYTLSYEKQGCTKDNITIEYSFKKRKIPFIKVKLFSFNFLLSDSFELLKQNKYVEIDKNIIKLDEIDPDDESLLYLKAIILYKREKYKESLELFEKLSSYDRKNVYYILPMVDIYDKLKWFRQKAELCLYIGKNFSNEYKYLIKTAAITYKDKLKDVDSYNIIYEEYRDFFEDNGQ